MNHQGDRSMMTRPDAAGEDPDEMTKDITIRLRVTEDEQQAFQAAADQERMSLSNWIRRRCWGLPTVAPVAAESKPAKKPRRS
jgi:hypothetical protein